MQLCGRIIVILCMATLSIFGVSAQDSCYHSGFNRLGLNLFSYGGLGNARTPALIWPAGSGYKALKRQAFWVSGTNAGVTFSIGTDVYGKQTDFCIGPAANNCKDHYRQGDIPLFNDLSDSLVKSHLSHYKQTGYTIPPAILNWPANGKTGYSGVIAAFGDKNGNNLYEPATGEYPYINGNRSVLSIVSDSAGKTGFKTRSNCLDMSINWFSIKNDTADYLNNTVFVRNTICNRGNTALTNVVVASVLDFMIGDENDNYIQTAVDLNSLVGYNGNADDAVYGKNWPYVSFTWLSPGAGASIYFENNTFNSIYGRPTDSGHFYNLSRALWKTGNNMTFGKRGLDNGIKANFVFSNGTDTAFKNKAPWSEKNNNLPGTRTGLISSQPISIDPGTCKIIDGALIITPNDVSDSLVFRKQISRVIQYYKNSNFVLSNPIVPGINHKLSLMPCPMANFGQLQLNGFNTQKPVYIQTTEGKILKQVNTSWQGFKLWPLGCGLFLIRQEMNVVKLIVY